jgi:hypothetical protein
VGVALSVAPACYSLFVDGRHVRHSHFSHKFLLLAAGSVHYLEFSTKAGQYGQPGGLSTVGSVEAKDLVTNERTTGRRKASEVKTSAPVSFEMLVGPSRLPGFANYLPTDDTVEAGRGLFMVCLPLDNHHFF